MYIISSLIDQLKDRMGIKILNWLKKQALANFDL